MSDSSPSSRSLRPLSRAAAGLAAASVLALAGCAAGSSGQVEPAEAPGAAGADSRVGAAAEPAGTATAVEQSRSLVKSSSALLGVTDLSKAHADLIAVVRSNDGTVVTEYVSAGRIGSPTPRPAASVPGVAEDGSPARVTGAADVPDWYWDRYPDFVDVSFTVPAARYESTLDRVRVLGTVVHLQQNITDVTTAVADLDARIGAARASVLRVQALLAKAATIEQVLLIEKELTARQSNLESLQAQQRALAGQVAESTLTVRLVPADAVVASVPAEQSWWSKLGEAFARSWQVLALVVAVTSPLWLLGGLLALVAWWVWRRRRAARTASIEDLDAA